MGADAVPNNAGPVSSNLSAESTPLVATPDSAGPSKKRPPWSASTWWKLSAAAFVILALVAYLMRNVVLGTPTAVYAATSGELVQTVVASGRVISPQRVSVALQGTGRVIRVAVEEGQALAQAQAALAKPVAGRQLASAKVAQGEVLAPSSGGECQASCRLGM